MTLNDMTISGKTLAEIRKILHEVDVYGTPETLNTTLGFCQNACTRLLHDNRRLRGELAEAYKHSAEMTEDLIALQNVAHQHTL